MATADELKEELTKLTEEVKKLRKQMKGEGGGGDAPDAAAPDAASSLANLKKEEEALKKMVGAYEKRNKAASGDNLFQKQKTEILDNQGKQIEKQNEDLFKKKKLDEDDVDRQKDLGKLFEKKTKEQKKSNKQAKKTKDASKEISKSLERQVSIFTHKLAPSVATFNTALEGLKTPLKTLHGAMTGIGTGMINNMIAMNFELYDMENAFRAATGASTEFARSVTNTYAATRAYGVTAKQARETNEKLFTTFTDFTRVSVEQREALAETGAVLQRLGVGAADYAKLIQASTKYMGENADQAEASAREMVAFAKDIGISPKQMIEDYGKVSGELAKLGSAGKRAFKDLEMSSKVTGIAVDRLLKITEKFDTFEGAAEQAGKLNAALGGNFVNAMDLMMETDPAARFGMIQDALTDAGLSFDDMSYYQRKFYADSLGLADVGELAMAMSGKSDELSGSLNKNSEELIAMKENAASVNKLQDQFNSLIAAATPVLTPLIDNLRTLMKYLAENQEVVTQVLQAFMAYKALMIAVNVVQAISNIKFLLFAAALAGIAYILYEKNYASNFIEGMWNFVGAALALMAGLTLLSFIVKKNQLSFAGFAVAALALGGAFYIASMAIENISDSLLKLGPQAKDLNTTLAIMGATILGLFITLTVLAVKTGGIAVVAVLAFGAAVMAMGLGAYMAAEAFDMLVDTWMRAPPEMLWSMVAAVAALAAAVVAVASAGYAGVGGLAAVAGFVLAIAYAFKLVADSVAAARTAMADMFNAAGAIDLTALEQMAAQFEAISAAMDEVPLVKVIAWTAIMDKVQIEVPAARAVAPAAAMANAVPPMLARERAAGGTTGTAPTPEWHQEITINVELDGEPVGTKTMELLYGKAKSAILSIGG